MPQKKQQVKFSFGTQAEYNALPIKNQNTFYIITDTQKIYIGNKMYTSRISNIDNSSVNFKFCTENEYNEMTNRTATEIYFVLNDSVLSIKDANNNLLTLGNAGGRGGGSAYATTDAAIFAVAENVIIAPITAGTVTTEE